MRKRTRIPLEQRFWKYIQKTDTCWLWTGKSLTEFGYGLINMGGRDGKIERAHRVSWILHYGEIPKGIFVCHKCDNPLCVRPDHLFLGTNRDNVRDMIAKDRHSHTRKNKGERHFNHKMSDTLVTLIRSRYPQSTISEMAREYGVSITTIWNIVHRYTWKHV